MLFFSPLSGTCRWLLADCAFVCLWCAHSWCHAGPQLPPSSLLSAPVVVTELTQQQMFPVIGHPCFPFPVYFLHPGPCGAPACCLLGSLWVPMPRLGGPLLCIQRPLRLLLLCAFEDSSGWLLTDCAFPWLPGPFLGCPGPPCGCPGPPFGCPGPPFC